MSRQPAPPPPSSHVGRIAVIIAIILFVIGLVVYISSEGEVQQQAQQQTVNENTSANESPQTTPTATRVEGQVIVKFKAGVTDAQITERLTPLNASIKSKIDGINATVISVPPGQEDAVLQELSTDPLVQYAEPDYIYYLQLTPNDTEFGKQWHLVNTGQTVVDSKNVAVVGKADADIDADLAWDVSRGTGVKVAVLDSGLDTTHPEFTGRVVGSKVFATTSIVDKNGHGTHVAGILAANTNNGQGIAGVCPDCQLLIGKITNDDANGSVPGSAIAPSITWAADSGAQVINMSIAGPSFSQAVQDAVNYAWGKNVVIVAAAGNDGVGNVKKYPAGYTNVVAVANTNPTDVLTGGSNFGTWVHIAAPGNRIYATFPTTPTFRGDTNYAILNGTSMASPVVAGVAALVWKTQYGTNNAAVVQRLFATTDKIAGTGTNFMNGRVNAAAAVGANTNPSAAPSAGPGPSGNPVPSSVVPTFVCGGSTNSICPIPSTTGPVVVPSGGTNPLPTNGTTLPISPVPSGTVNPTIPCETGTSVAHGKRKSKHKKKERGGVNNFVNVILRFFLELLNLILKLIGGGQIPIPGGINNPCAPAPVPSITPSVEPSLMPSVEPSEMLEPSISVPVSPVPSN